MRVVCVAFASSASEMFRSEDGILVTRDGAPAGFFLPWDAAELPVEVRREVFLRLSGQIGAQLDANGASESEVRGDFAQSRGGRRAHVRPAYAGAHPQEVRKPDGSLGSGASLRTC